MAITVVSLSSDRLLFDPESAVRARMRAYATELGSLVVIVTSLHSERFLALTDGPLTLIPTSSFVRGLQWFDAARIARTIPSDVITVQDPFELGLAGVLAKRGRPLHVQVHTDLTDPAYTTHSFINKVRKLLARFVLTRATRVRVVSQGIAHSLQEKYKIVAPVSVLPIFVDVSSFASALEAHSKSRLAEIYKLLWVGRLEPEKRPSLALQTLEMLIKSGEKAELSFAGDGSLRETLEKEVSRLGLQKQVHFLGRQRDLVPLYADTDVLLVTSAYEGYGMVFVEALASGVPVISTPVGIAQELVQQGVVVVPAGHYVEEAAEHISKGLPPVHLTSYPYKSFTDYVTSYADDLRACVVRAIV